MGLNLCAKHRCIRTFSDIRCTNREMAKRTAQALLVSPDWLTAPSP